jgi:hypothetical protein
MLTKKAYEMVACAVRRADAVSPEERSFKRELVRRLCNEFHADNPRFDMEKFVVACYGPSPREYDDVVRLCAEIGA